ncbi:MAG: DUF3024 domain-containing protein [bacterium]
MSFNDIQQKQIERAINNFMATKRPPPEIRDQLDFKIELKGQSIIIYEVRPRFDDKSKIMNHEVAKTTYVKRTNVWKIYWMRADLKWHGYQPKPQVKNIDAFFKVVDEDKHCCFFG